MAEFGWKVYIAPGARPADPTSWSWVDITGDTLTRDGGIEVEIGRADEASFVNATEVRGQVNNAGGHYVPTNPMGRWYPNLRRNTPMRVALGGVVDTFARPDAASWGTASSGLPWVANIGAAGLSLSGGAGRIDFSTGARRPFLSGPVMRDADVAVSVRIPTASAVTGDDIFVGPEARAYQLDTGVQVGYAACMRVRPAIGVTIHIVRANANGTFTYFFPDDPAVLPYSGSTTYRVRLRIEGNLMLGKVWDAAGAEPAVWHTSVITAEWLEPGPVGMRANLSASTATPKPHVLVDDFTAEADLAVVTVPKWSPRWDRSGRDCWVPFTGAGMLRRLGQGKTPLRSPLTRQMLSQGPAAYIPFEDDSDASFFAASVVSGAPAASAYGVTFGQDDTLPGASSTASMAAGSLVTIKVPAHSVDAAGWSVVLFAKMQALPPAEFEIAQITTPGGTVKTWSLRLSNTAVTLLGFDSTGATVSSAAAALGGISPTVWMAYQVKITATGGTVSPNVWFYPLTDPSVNNFYNLTLPTFAGSVGAVSTIKLTGNTGWIGGQLAHVGYFPQPNIEFFNLDFSRAAWGYIGETAGARIHRLFIEQGIPLMLVDGDSEPLGRQKTKTFLDLVREAETTDMGTLRELGAGGHYTPRGAKYNQPADATFDFAAASTSDGDGDVSEAPEPDYDDQRVRNDITVSREDGSSARAVDLAHVEAEGSYDEQITVSLPDDTRLESHANWRLSLGINDELRWPKIVLNLSDRPDLAWKVLALRVGARITLTDPPDEVLGTEVDVIVEGIVFELTQVSLIATLTCSPASPWQVGKIGSARVGGTGALTTPITSTGTGMIFSSTSAWTQRPAAMPFEMEVGGERVRVVAPGNALYVAEFDTGVDSWYPANGGSVAWAAGVGLGGGALRFTPPGGVLNVGASPPHLQNVLVPGTTYRLAGWVLSTAGSTDTRLVCDYFDASFNFISGDYGSPVTLTAGVWTHLDRVLSGPVPVGTVWAQPRLAISATPAASNLFYLDHFLVIDAATVATASPWRYTTRRSVNRVVKAHGTGTSVRLYRPARIAL